MLPGGAGTSSGARGAGASTRAQAATSASASGMRRARGVPRLDGVRSVLLALTVCLLAVLGAWWLFADGKASASAVAPHAAAGQPGREGARVPDVHAPSERERVRADDTAARELEVSHAARASATPHRVVARALDPRGAPIANAWIAVAGSAPVAGNAAGELEWHGELEVAPDAALLVNVGAPGFARRDVERPRQHGDTTWLGDLDLVPGTSLTGRVVERGGAPVTDATVLMERFDGRSASLVPRVLDAPVRVTGTKLRTQESDADGTFRFDGVPEGEWLVLAGSPRHRWSASSRRVLVAGSVDDLGDLALVPVDVETSLWVRLLSPAGEPLEGVHVLAMSGPDRAADTGFTDSEGRLRLELGEADSVRVRADPPEWDWGALDVADLRPGPTEHTLRFGAPDWLWARVRDEGGRALTRGRVHAESPTQRGRRLGRSISDLWNDGRARLHRPGETFVLVLDAPGFEADPVGPFEPRGVREPIEIVARPVAGVRGRVVRDGRGVPDVEVHLVFTSSEYVHVQQAWRGEGEPFRYLARSYRPPVTTDRQGAFALRPPGADATSPGAFLIVREGESVLGVHGPVELERLRGDDELEVELAPLATLAGTLTNSSSAESAGGWRVIACDAMLGLVETRCDADGGFRLDGLHAGGWQVRAFAPDADFASTALLPEDFAAPTWDVVLAGGQAARLDLRVEDAEVRVIGRLALRFGPGADDSGVWLVDLVDAEADERTWLFSSAQQVDAEGRFYAKLHRPGPYLVRLSHAGDSRSSLDLERRVELTAGVQELELRLHLAGFRATWPDAPPPTEPEGWAGRRFEARGIDDGGWEWQFQTHFTDAFTGKLPVGRARWTLSQQNFPADARVGVENALDVRGDELVTIELP